MAVYAGIVVCWGTWLLIELFTGVAWRDCGLGRVKVERGVLLRGGKPLANGGEEAALSGVWCLEGGAIEERDVGLVSGIWIGGLMVLSRGGGVLVMVLDVELFRPFKGVWFRDGG